MQELYAYKNLLPGEEVSMIVRRHWFFNFIVLGSIFLNYLPAIVIGLSYFGIFADINSPSGQVGIIIALYYFIYTLIKGFMDWIVLESDLFIVTNKRVISYQQITAAHKETVTAYLNQIQDVKGEIKGLFPILFRYGNLYIQTAADKVHFEIANIPRPEKTAEQILCLIEEVRGDGEFHGHDNSPRGRYVGRKKPDSRMDELAHLLKYRIGKIGHKFFASSHKDD